MSAPLLETSVEIMGKSYQIKCPEPEVASLQQAALYLDTQMNKVRDAGVMNVDRVAVITALNIVHQLLTLEQNKNQSQQAVNDRLQALQSKLDEALAESGQWELSSAR